MQASYSTVGAPAPRVIRINRRVLTAIVVVVVAHAVLLALVLSRHDDVVVPVALESKTITAELLKPAPVAAPAAIQSTPLPQPLPMPHVTHVPRAKPAPEPKPKPTPLPVENEPSPLAAETPAAPAPPTPAAPAPETVAAAPAEGRPTMALDAPRNVSHLDCRISQPDYPVLSRKRGETGVAYVRFVVGLSGAIEDVELKKSSGFDRLDDAAIAAMRDSSCKPYLENGQPVRAAYTQPFDFSLRD